MRKVVLDTNGYTKLLLGDKTVLGALGSADKVFIPAVVLGELFAGFRGGTKENKNKKLLENFLSKPQVEIIIVGKEVAEIFGEIKYSLTRMGTPMPINDLWIASSAVEVGAVIITYDKHFLKIPKARVWDSI